MEFLVRSENRAAARVPRERARSCAARAGPAMELRAEGDLKRLWRVPAPKPRRVYEADDPAQLHDALIRCPGPARRRGRAWHGNPRRGMTTDRHLT